MTDAVLQATYSDFKLIKTRKVISLSFEVPIEQANQVYAALGMPDPSKERWVAIAALVAQPKGLYGQGMVSILDSAEKTAQIKEAVDGATRRYGDYAKALKLQGFFRFREVQEKIGTDAEFREWVKKQPSCISGKYDCVEGGAVNIAAHVRRAAASGTGYKPPYSCVPLTNAEHQLQHQHGERAVLQGRDEADSITQAKAWFDRQAIEHAARWAWEKFKEIMSSESMADISPERIKVWAETNGVANLLPKEFRS